MVKHRRAPRRADTAVGSLVRDLQPVSALAEVQRRFPDGLPILDPIENMDITDESFRKLLRKIEVLESRLLANRLHLSPLLPTLWDQYHVKAQLGEKITWGITPGNRRTRGTRNVCIGLRNSLAKRLTRTPALPLDVPCGTVPVDAQKSDPAQE